MKTTMRKAFFIITLLISACASAQTADNIVAALKSGSASQIARYFQPSVELSLQDGAHSYNKSQAQEVLANFFSKHAFRSYNIVHQGTSPEGAKYVIGTLETADKTYRVYMYAVTKENTLSIKELRFEEE
ncbi:MAG TPA: DUF4783 domain-containing protein [Chitinophagales bacterium]